MSDDTTEDHKPDKDKRSDYDRANAKGDVSPDNERIFEFLDSLFIDDKNFPESIDVRQVAGTDYHKYGDPVKKIPFSSSTKPGKERLVSLTNDILLRMRQDCDVRQKETVYHIAARNPALGEDFYDRILFRCKPSKRWAKRGEELGIGGGVEGDDDEMSFASRYNMKMLEHHEKWIGLVGGMLEGLIDRGDRQATTAFSQLERAQAKNLELLEVNIRMAQADDERQERREKAKMWRENINKGLDMAWKVLPPMLTAFTGNKNGGPSGWVPNTESIEASTLRSFFETKDSGGFLTAEQFEVVCGTPNKEGVIVRPGILTPEQVNLLVQVANLKENPESLDFLTSGGKYEISQAQAMAILQAGIPMEALAPIKMLLDVRMAKRQQQNTDPKET